MLGKSGETREKPLYVYSMTKQNAEPHKRTDRRTSQGVYRSLTQSWLGSFYSTTICCLEDDLESYQLLDLDAEDMNDPDLHVGDVLAE